MLTSSTMLFLLITFLALLPSTISSPMHWPGRPKRPVSTPSPSQYTSELQPVAIPANPRTGKPRPGPVDLKAAFPYPIFATNAEDHDHTVTIFGEGRECSRRRTGPMAQIRGVPKAIMAEERWRKGVAQGGLVESAQGDWGKPGQVEGNLMWDSAVDDGWGGRKKDWKPSTPEKIANMVVKTGMIGHAYGNPLTLGEGKSSACIHIDVNGQGAGSVLLERSTLRVPRTMAAMWHGESCEGEPDRWLTMRIGETRDCRSEPNGNSALWRSMRVWYGSERLAPEQWGEDKISLNVELTAWRGGR